MIFQQTDLNDLKKAKALLENPGIAARITDLLGTPIEKGDDASESGYFAIRAALAQSITKATEYIAGKGMAEEGAPALVR